MYRPQLTNVKDIKRSDLIVQLSDWQSYDYAIDDENNENSDSDDELNFKKYKERRFTMFAYGITKEGYSISLKINDFTPYFFVRVPLNWGKKEAKLFKNALNKSVKFYLHKHLIDVSIVKRVPFYGFTNNTQRPYIRLTFNTLNAFYSYKRAILESNDNPFTIYNEDIDLSKNLCESKVTPLIRFFHIRDLKPVGWIYIPRHKVQWSRIKKTRCQLECSVHYSAVQNYDLNEIGKFVVASYDIECTSCDGTFPNAHRPNDKIIQIGTTINIFGSPKNYKYIATLKKCDPIEDCIVEEFEDERKLVIGWCEFIKKVDPDIITGYNIWGFDWKYIYDRAKNGNGGTVSPYDNMLMRRLARMKNEENEKVKAKFIEKELHSSALGQNFLYFIDIEGIVQIDLYKLIQKDYKLGSYKLDAVSKHFMKQQKEDLSPKELFRNYNRGTKADIKEIAVYCVQDCALCNNLLNKLQVIPNNVGMGNVCVIPLSYLFLRGQGIKIFSLVVKQCRLEGFIIKDLHDEDIDKASYEGAIVFVPEPGVYFEPVAVMDYASLYPSSMISENISHDSILGFRKYLYKKGANPKKYIVNSGPENSPELLECVEDTINYKYNGLPEYNYTNIEYDIFEGKGDDKKIVGVKVCRFAERKDLQKSALPRILMDLLKARRDTRKKMKYKTCILNDGSKITGLYNEDEEYVILKTVEGKSYKALKSNIVNTEDTYNAFEKAVLDGQQLAFKVTCNSLYGQVGASTSSICFKELAASTTATGRRMVLHARDYTLEKYQGSTLVYGDTDSVFINFTPYIKKKYKDEYPNGIDDVTMMNLTIKTGQEAGKYVTSKLKPPQDLEYEKVFWPFMIFSKKRYVGNKYEFNPKKYKQTSMGIVLKRRDNAPVVKDVYGGIIDYILNHRNIKGSIEFYKQKIRDLLNGKVDINKLIITKSLKANYANPTTIPHKVLADRMGERDPGNKPQSNDRVPYAYIDVSNHKCEICKTKVKKENCKCVKCMKLFCPHHVKNHKEICVNLCRFCKRPETYTYIKKEKGVEIPRKGKCNWCNICHAYYCHECFQQHKRRKNKYGQIFFDKCKKPLSTKLIQGDIVEEPKYIIDNNLKIDYMYYLEHQIEKPVTQIFELVDDNPKKILEQIKREFHNKKSGNTSITSFFKIKAK